MRCLYEVLDVAKDAEDSEIKSGYRKAALRWHPDKNQGNLAEAEERFKEVQNAYEVLSDKHERAWYDSHRLDILRAGSRHQAGGSSQFAGGEAPEDEVELYSYFSSTCFSGYKDGPAGFYGVYEDLFQIVSQQETDCAKFSDQNLKAQDLPKFGTSQTSWADVAAFYGAWSSFSTCKAFSWADQYNPASAPNRKVRRLMEDENKKARKAQRRKFNDTVRELVAFVKKRDKRVAAHQAEEAKRRLQKEAEEEVRREEERKLRLQRAREYEEAEWAQLDEEGNESEEEIDNFADELYCVACDKIFRSQGAMQNHEKSKKHLEKLEILKAMLEEEAQLELPEDTANGEKNGHQAESEELDNFSQDNESDIESDANSEKKPHIASPQHPRNGKVKESQVDESDSADEISHEEMSHEGIGSEEEEAEQEAEYEDESDMLAALLSLQNRPQKKFSGKKENIEKQEANFGEKIRSSEDEADLNQEKELQDNPNVPESDASEGGQKDVKSKKKSRRRQKPSKAEAKSQVSEERDTQPIENSKSSGSKEVRRKKGKNPAKRDDLDSNLICSICRAEFGSRTKLFKHIKDSGHAALKGNL